MFTQNSKRLLFAGLIVILLSQVMAPMFVSAQPAGTPPGGNIDARFNTVSAVNTGGVTAGEDKTGSANTAGLIKLFSAGDNAYYTTFTAGTQTGNAGYTLPTGLPGADSFLKSNTSGVLSWSASAGAETDPTLIDDGAVTFGAGTGDVTLTFDGPTTHDATIKWDGTNDEFEIPTGKIGIGETVPVGKVDIVAPATYNSEPGGLHITSAAGALNKVVQIGYDAAIDAGFIRAYQASTGSKSLVLQAGSGNLGVGATTPAYKLDVSGTGRFTGDVQLGVNPSTDTSAIARGYVLSRGMNLVTNGSGLLGNNYNFSSFTFSQNETHGGMGSFMHSGAYTPKFSDELIPVDSSKYYKLVGWGKDGETGGANYDPANVQYAGLVAYDIDGNAITPETAVKFGGSTDTTLTSQLNVGDTVMHVANATGWNNANCTAAWYSCGFSWWPYTNSKGYTWPNYTYTRNISWYNAPYSSAPTWNTGGISGNDITLAAAWPGPVLPSGTAVRNTTSGSTYKYILASTVTVPNTWTRYEGTIGGVDYDSTMDPGKFYQGTAFVKLMFLPNFTGTGNIRWSDLWLSELTSSNMDMASATKAGMVSLANQQLGTGDKYFGGKVGIGNTSPGSPLEVTGMQNNSPFWTNTRINIGTTTGHALGAITFRANGGDTAGIGYQSVDSTHGELTLNTVNGGALTERVRVDAAGNVGIGTGTPSTKLHVVGGARVTGLVSCDTIDTDANGVMSCGTDASGVGAQSLQQVTDTGATTTNAITVDSAGGHTTTVGGALDVNATITAGTGNTTLTDSAGKILSAALNTVAAGQGGTGITSAGTAGNLLQSTGSGWQSWTPTYLTSESDPNAILKSIIDAAGDLVVGTGDNTYTRLAKGTANQVLKMDGTGTNVTWGTDATGMSSETQTLQDVTTLGATTTSDVTLDSDGGGTTTVGGELAVKGAAGLTVGLDKTAGTNNTPGVIKLISDRDNAYYSSFTTAGQTANATYLLPESMPASNGFLKSNSTGTMSWDTSTYLTSYSETDPLAVLKATFTTAGDLLLGSGAGTYSRLGIGTNGQVLKSNGTTAAWAADAGITAETDPTWTNGGNTTNAISRTGTVSVSTGTTANAVTGSMSNTTAGSYAVKGDATGATGASYGVYGANSSTSGMGVYGNATGATGTTYGVYGQTASASGYGGFFTGNNTGTALAALYNGNNYVNLGTNGYGVDARGTTVAVYGATATGTDGSRGVEGRDNGTTGSGYGVYGSSASTAGTGVYGYADGSTAAGVKGESVAGDALRGTATGGGNGVRGVSSTGYGVYGSSSTNGVYGATTSTTEAGVTGLASATTGSTAMGVYGSSSGANGEGVHGLAGGSNGIGVRGDATGATAYGAQFYNTTGTALYTNGGVQFAGGSFNSCNLDTDASGNLVCGSDATGTNYLQRNTTTLSPLNQGDNLNVSVINSTYAVQGANQSSGYGVSATSSSGAGLYASSTTGYAGIFDVGKVGIGDTTPSYKLEVTDTDNASLLANASTIVANLTQTGTGSCGDCTDTDSAIKGIATNTGTVAGGHVKIIGGSFSASDAAIGEATGVYGTASGGNANYGVQGYVGAGTGAAVMGSSSSASAYGVDAYNSTSGMALHVYSNSGYGAYFEKGYVGIGTATPGYRLDVQGSGVAGQINAAGGLCIAGDCKTSWPTYSNYWQRNTTTLSPATANDNVSVTSSNASYAIQGSSTTASAHGVSGLNSGGGIAVYGHNTNTSGSLNYGGFFVSDGGAGEVYTSTGVYGQGATHGVIGVGGTPSGSSLGVGVGVMGTTTDGTAVFGTSVNGTGVYGASTLSSGVYAYGYPAVYGNTDGATSSAVMATNNATTGTNYGVYATDASASGYGVYAHNSASGNYSHLSGPLYAVYGESSAGDSVYGWTDTSYNGVHGYSTDGNGVYGESANGSGVYAYNNSSGAYGYLGGYSEGAYVYRNANNYVTLATTTSGVLAQGLNDGVQGIASSASGRGVEGVATSATGTTYGVSGSAASSAGYGGYFANSSSGVGLYASSTSGTALDVNGFMNMRGMTAPAVSAAGQARVFFDSVTNKLTASQNAGFRQEVGVFSSSKPVQSVNGTCTTSTGNYTMGYRFAPASTGYITHLGIKNNAGSYTLKLWSDAGTLITSVSVYATNSSQWVYAPIAPYYVTAGTYVRVSMYTGGASGSYCSGTIAASSTYDGITYDQGYYGTGDIFPNTSSGSTLHGQPDIIFTPVDNVSGTSGYVMKAREDGQLAFSNIYENGGLVGIGTRTPYYALHVKANGAEGAIYAEHDSTTYGALGYDDGGDTMYGTYGYAVNGSYESNIGAYGYGSSYGVYGSSSSVGVYGTGSTYGVHGATSGSIGVYGQNTGTTGGSGVYGYASGATGAQEAVMGTAASTTGYGGYFTNTSSGIGLYASSSTGYAALFENGAVGIGTLTPSAPLDVRTDANNYTLLQTGTRGLDARSYGDLSSSMGVYGYGRTTSTGASSAYGVYGYGYSANGTAYGVYASAGSSTGAVTYGLYQTGGTYNYLGSSTGIATSTPTTTLDVNGTARVRTVNAGTYSTPMNRTADGTFTTATSDGRLKEKLEPLASALKNVLMMKPYTFNWKASPDGPRDIGLIAQDLKELYPQLVYQSDDGMYAINYPLLTVVLVKAMQDQNMEVEAKQVQIDDLKSQLDDQQKQIDELKALVEGKVDNKVSVKANDVSETEGSSGGNLLTYLTSMVGAKR
jgi:hypothetical protein